MYSWRGLMRLVLLRSVLAYSLMALSLVLFVSNQVSLLQAQTDNQSLGDLLLQVTTIEHNLLNVDSNTSTTSVHEIKDVTEANDVDPDFERCRTFVSRVRQQRPLYTVAATYDRCGRQPNQVLHWSRGRFACVRYRTRHLHLIAGDLLSYYVAELLGLEQVPCLALVRTRPLHWWAFAETPDGWTDDSFALVSQWIPDLQRAQVDETIRKALNSNSTGKPFEHEKMSEDFAVMVLFDYVTGHYDRLAAVQDDYNQRGRPIAEGERLRNVARAPDGRLWLFDNEAGMLDGYTLLHKPTSRRDHQRFTAFHDAALAAAICSVPPRILRRLRAWAEQPDSLGMLLEHVGEREGTVWRELWAEIEAGSDPVLALHLHVEQLREHFNRRLLTAAQLSKHCSHN